MVIGYHLIWTVYGWWLPNDPRGSSSHEIRVEKLEELGDIHHGRKKVQPRRQELQAFYEKAQDLLTHPVLLFSEEEIQLIAGSIREVIQQQYYTCYACAIMPEHIHLLIRRHRDKSEQMLEHFQQHSRQVMIDAGRRRSNHPVWGGRGWSVFLNSVEGMERVVRYIQHNPRKSGLPIQAWDFVKSYDGWLPAYAHYQK
jgi:REP element-mobilizing transposase RayT